MTQKEREFFIGFKGFWCGVVATLFTLWMAALMLADSS